MSTSDTYVTVAAKIRDHHSAVSGRRSRRIDNVESDSPQRYSKAQQADKDGCDAAEASGSRISSSRRRRQRTAGAHRKSRQQQQQQPEVMTSPLRRVDSDDDDDAGSVCSGASSASENSTASRGSAGSGRPGRRPRGTSRSTRTSSSIRRGSGDTVRHSVALKSHIPSIDVTLPTEDETVSGSCCSVKRPEPEGGVQIAASKSPMSDEFNRLIYGPSEPLFSDGEDCVPVTLDDDVDFTKDCTTTITTSTSVRPAQHQRRRFTGSVADVDSSTENMFNAAQMINSNNMMKFAIIQMELRNVKDVSLRRMESDVSVLCGRLKAVCEASSQTVSGLNSAAELHAELSAQLSSCTINDTSHHHQASSSVDRHSRQMAPRSQSTTTTTSCGSVERHFIVTDDDIELAERRLDDAETRVSQLETELKSVVNSLSSNVSNSDHQHRDKAIRDTTLRLKEAEHQAAVSESELFRLRRIAAVHRDEVTADVKKYAQISGRLGITTFADVTGC